MNQTWWNDYIGLPYVERGRDRRGLDCWGLVRLVHAEQFGHELPSFDGDYDDASNRAHLRELIARHREGWKPVDVPQSGDVAVFRILGEPTHVGVVTQPGFFLHVRQGQTSTIERLDSVEWRNRLDGIYRYCAADTAITVSAAPHPLKTERIDALMPAGTTLQEMVDKLREMAGVSPEIEMKAAVWVDGRIYAPQEWATMVPAPGSRVELRAVAGKDALRSVLMLAVIVVAAIVAPYLAPVLVSIGVPAAAATAVATAALTLAGTLLVNAIFPVRLPDSGKGIDSPTAQNLLTGGRNSVTPYGAIPVVLGRVRYTPPLAAQAYVESDAVNSYLRMPLLWGYGPLQLDNLAIGDTPLSSYEEVQTAHLVGRTGESGFYFGLVYGRDTNQQQIGLPLENKEYKGCTVVVSGGIATVTVPQAHGFSVGMLATLSNSSLSEYTINSAILTVPSSTTFTCATTEAAGTYTGHYARASGWITRIINETVDSVTVALHFPEGLRRVKVTGDGAGTYSAQPFRAVIETRQLDSNLNPITGWSGTFFDPYTVIWGTTFSMSPAYVTTTAGGTSSVYRWTRVSAGKYGNLVIRTGAVTDSPNAAPSGTLLATLSADMFGLTASTEILPTLPDDETPLWDICVYGGAVYSTVNRRGTEVSGAGLTYTGLTATVADGTVDRADKTTVMLGASGEQYYLRKDAFTYNVTFTTTGIQEVRVRRLSASTADYGDGDQFRRMLACQLVTITGYANRRPITPPQPLCMTALRIKATGQLNGNIEGIQGTVFSIAKDWDAGTSTWIERPTRNPASLFRHVLQHPANARRLADSQIDLTTLQDWHDYCATNGFTYDAVITDQRSLLDVLGDIAAAGRASPTMRDGKWTVVIDRQRSVIAQHFTPHNSWGFEGVRALPKIPHAFRVQFINSERGFQPDERIVYDDGYSSGNATLIEGLQLPGVTSPATVYKHARFHLAQLRLRPETYTLNVDIEHLICTRGDLVRVTHDVPMWGLATGRIKNFLTTTTLELDEAVPMVAGTQYTIRIRQNDGSSITRTVASVGTDGEYTSITLTSAVTSTQGAAGLMFMFGSLNAESVELVVQAIEPAENMTARLTLVDYSPAVYSSDTGTIPAFNSQITKPPLLLQNAITVSPSITNIASDETVLQLLPSGAYDYGMRVSFTNPSDLPKLVNAVQAEIDYANDGVQTWQSLQTLSLNDSSVTFMGLREGDAYVVRLRYVDEQGRTGPWAVSSTHTVIGKTTPPATPTGLSLAVSGSQLLASWNANAEIDVVGYELRSADTGWGGTGALFTGSTLSTLVNPPAAGASGTYYLKAYDAAGLYSTAALSVTYTSAAVPNVASITEEFADTSLTNATITLTWPQAAPAFGVDSYLVNDGTTIRRVYATTITLQANWLGSRTFTVQTVDSRGNVSTGTSKTITKLAPNPVTGQRAQVIDNNVLLYWTLPAKTTLPISHVRIKRGATWATAADIGIKAGSFTSVAELQAGTYTYWFATVDTDGYESTPVSLAATVSAPPDFIFNGQQTSTFAGTKTNALLENGALVIPADTTETWASHFTTRSWTSPQDQINAGFPVYIQPTPNSGTYVETFDFGTVLASSKVTVAYSGTTVAGTPVITPKIELSANASTWQVYDGQVEVYGTSFRYVRFTLTVAGSGGDEVYQLNSLNCTLASKLKNDAGQTACLSTDTNGTVANFTSEFVDVSSIQVTATGTTAITAVYDFQDAITTGTYSVTSNVATLNVTGHGLAVGQNVRLTFSSGTAPSGVYTVASAPSANQFTVNITTANTSGNVSTYPQGMRIYLFNSSGTRVSATASWSIRGN